MSNKKQKFTRKELQSLANKLSQFKWSYGADIILEEIQNIDEIQITIYDLIAHGDYKEA